jgi:hypothetical protein
MKDEHAALLHLSSFILADKAIAPRREESTPPGAPVDPSGPPLFDKLGKVFG